MNLYCYGSYGTGNLGDDAIFSGLKNEYYGHACITQIYISKQTHVNGISEEDLLLKGFKNGDMLIIGGGGLFHSELNSSNILKMAQDAKSKHMEIIMKSVGLEAVQGEWEKDVREVMKLCSSISLRSNRSLKLIGKMGFSNPEKFVFERDLAYNIRPNIAEAKKIFPEFEDDLPVIGIATAHNGNMEPIGDYIRHLMTDFNLLHIPHCKHYTDQENNDLASGHLLWSNMNIHLFDRLKRYKRLTFPDDPETLLGIYHLLDGMVGYRYHSFIFSEMAGTKLYGMPCGDKAIGYFEDHPGYKYKGPVDSHDDLADEMKKLFHETHKTKSLKEVLEVGA